MNARSRVYHEIDVSVPARHHEAVLDALYAAGISGLWDRSVQGASVFRVYLPRVRGGTDPERFADRVRASLPARVGHALRFSSGEIEEEDWAENWKVHFRPFRLGRRIRIRPPWVRSVDPGTVDLCLNPGMAFGTGLHETTRLVCEAVERVAAEDAAGTGRRFLDLGTGSGILCVLAAKLGYAATGTDNDRYALEVARANLRRNRVRASFVRCDLASPRIAARGPYDLVVANILLPEVVRLAPRAGALLAPGGRLVVSGLLRTQGDEAVRAYREVGFRVVRRAVRGEWTAIELARRSGEGKTGRVPNPGGREAGA